VTLLPTDDPAPTTAATARRRWWWLAIPTVALVTAAICVGALCRSSSGGVAARAEGSGPAAPAALTVATADGSTFSAAAGRPTVLLFLSTQGCSDCAKQAKAVDQLAQQNARRVGVLGVEMDPAGSSEDLGSFSQRLGGLHYSLAIDTDSSLQRRFQALSLSTVVILDGAGRVVYRAVDPTPDALDSGLRLADSKA
jgi:peroxiredoxin